MLLHDPELWLDISAWLAAGFAVRLMLRAVRRVTRSGSICPACNYDVSGARGPGGPCPECGEIASEVLRRRRVRLGPLLAGVVLLGAWGSHWWWSTRLADRIWDRWLPREVLESDFTLDGLRWRTFIPRGERTLPRDTWDNTYQSVQVRHPLVGWIDVGDEALRVWFHRPDPDNPDARGLSPRDMTGDGVAEHFVSTYSGGAHCCMTLYVINLASATLPVVAIDGGHGDIELVESTSPPCLRIADWTFAYWHVSFVSSPAAEVIVSLRGGTPHPDVSQMRQPPPTDEELATLAEQTFFPENESLDHGDEAVFWAPMLDLLYSGNEAAAWELFDMIWPEGRPGKDAFRKEFLAQLEKSPWWPKIRAKYALESTPR